MRRVVGPGIILFAIDDPVTWIGRGLIAIPGIVLCLRVLDFLHAGAQRIVADNGATSTSINQRHFRDEVLRDRGFFAHLVFRALRKVDSFDRPSDRDSGSKKAKVLKASQRPLRAESRVLSRQLLLETSGLQTEGPGSLPHALWVEAGCRRAQTVVSGKGPHDYCENPSTAL